MTEAKTIPLYRPCHIELHYQGAVQDGYAIHSDCGKYIMAKVERKGRAAAGWMPKDEITDPWLYWGAEAERQRDYINKRAKGNAWERANE